MAGHLSLLTFTFAFALLAVAVAGFGLGYAAAAGRQSRPTRRAPEGDREPEEVPPAHVTFSPGAAEGTPEWDRSMGDAGARMRASGVRLALFVHGSFVGDDPLAIAQRLEGALPILPDLGRALRKLTRARVSRLVGDLSNYPRAYVEAFARGTGVEAADFVWSGENHHAARVQGAVRLARALALHGGGALRPGDRVLVLGHSHGGQLFAILSQLLSRAPGYEELVAAARGRGEDVGALEDHLAVLRRCPIDAVTLGTPPRYRWAPGADVRVLHVVNHRPRARRGHPLLGLLRTADGDYVHRLGGAGSDFPAPSAVERTVNARLDAVLGQGSSVVGWLRLLARGAKIAPSGRTLLVDYGDAARLLPNFRATGFGHAAYTRRGAMLFHARLIADTLYPSPAARAQPSSLGARARLVGRGRASLAQHRTLPAARGG